MGNTRTLTRNQNKATHTGTCQVCGARQKLPGGRLSKHGYTVQHGFFEGTCFGTAHEPFELAKNLIEESIRLATEKRDALLKQIEILQTNLAPRAWVHEYHRSTRRGPLYVWREVEITTQTHAHEGHEWLTFHYVDHEGKPARVENYTNRTLEAVCLMLNDRRAHALGQTVAEIERYIVSQRGRLAGWAPHPERLEPVK